MGSRQKSVSEDAERERERERGEDKDVPSRDEIFYVEPLFLFALRRPCDRLFVIVQKPNIREENDEASEGEI